MRTCTSKRAFSPNVKASTRYYHFTQAPESYQLCQAHQISVSSLQDLARSCMYPHQLAWKRASEATALCAVFALEVAHDGLRTVGGSCNSLASLQCPIPFDRYFEYTVYGQPLVGRRRLADIQRSSTNLCLLLALITRRNHVKQFRIQFLLVLVHHYVRTAN